MQTPTPSLSLWDGDGESARPASPPQRSGTHGEGHKPAKCKRKSGGTPCLLLMQTVALVQGWWGVPSRVFQLLIQEILGFLHFHARNLLLCPLAPLATPVYVLGGQGV